jgi:hypothetical protein
VVAQYDIVLSLCILDVPLGPFRHAMA